MVDFVIYMEMKFIRWLVALFSFFSDSFCQFTIWKFVTCTLRFLSLKRYISKHIGGSVLVSFKTCTASLQMTMFQTINVQKFPAQKVSSKINWKHQKFLGQIVEFD